MKRWPLLLLSLALLLLGCAIPAHALELSAPGEYPIVEEKITLTAFATLPSHNYYTEDLDSNLFTQYLEEKTNVHIDWNITYGASGSDAQTKLNLLLAGGDYPDMFLTTTFDKTSLYQAALDGILIPLNDLIDEHAVNIQAIFEESPGIRSQLTAPDGNIYGLGYISEYYHGEVPSKMWAYQPWLDALGLTAPQTTEEFYEMLVAFRDGDPNGNGEADEIPLLNLSYEYLMSPFIFYDGSNLMVEDGEVSFVANTEAYREGLRFLNKLYTEKLVPQDVFTMDGTQQSALTMNDPYKVGCMSAFSFGSLFTNLTDENCAARDLVPVLPLEGPDGTRQIPKNPFILSPNRFAITSACEYPEVAIKWADWLMDPYNYYTSSFGPQLDGPATDVQGWWIAGEDEVTILGTQALVGYTQLVSSDANYNNNISWGMQIGPWYNNVEFHTSKAVVPGTSSWSEVAYYRLSEAYEPYKAMKSVEFWGTPLFFMSAEGIDLISEYKTVINSLVEQYRAEFVTGVKDLDTDWDAYLADLSAMGLEHYVALYQQEYAAGTNP